MDIINGIEERMAWLEDWFSLPVAERRRRNEEGEKRIEKMAELERRKFLQSKEKRVKRKDGN
jgi:hypothetical protein